MCSGIGIISFKLKVMNLYLNVFIIKCYAYSIKIVFVKHSWGPNLILRNKIIVQSILNLFNQYWIHLVLLIAQMNLLLNLMIFKLIFIH